MFSKGNIVLLLLDRSGFILFRGTLTNILKFTFTPEVVSNLDVVNKDLLKNLIVSFIENNKIPASIVIVLLTDAVIYEKNLTNEQSDVQKFLDSIPFEDVLAKAIKTEKLSLMVGTNRDLVFSVIDPFIKKGFIIEAVVPSFLYGQNINITNGLTVELVKSILKHPELLKSVNLLIGQQLIRELSGDSSMSAQKENKTEEKPKKRQLILIVVFVALFVVMLIMLFTSGIIKN